MSLYMHYSYILGIDLQQSVIRKSTAHTAISFQYKVRTFFDHETKYSLYQIASRRP